MGRTLISALIAVCACKEASAPATSGSAAPPPAARGDAMATAPITEPSGPADPAAGIRVEFAEEGAIAAGETELSSTTVDDLLRSKYFATIAPCYAAYVRERVAAGDTPYRGQLRIDLTVTETGKTTAVQLDGYLARDATLEPCVKQAIAAWTFPIPIAKELDMLGTQPGDPTVAGFTILLQLSVPPPAE